MTARILAYSYNGQPAYLPNWDGAPILTRDVGASIVANWERRPQDPDLREGHSGTRALGWVRRVWEDEDGLYAIAELTPDGESLIASGAYKYVSPSIATDIVLPSGEVLEGWHLMHVALTNDPAQYGGAVIVEMERTSRTLSITTPIKPESPTEEATMDTEQITASIAETIQQAIAPIAEQVAQLQQAVDAMREQRERDDQQRVIADLQREIESWRYDNGQAIPPAVAHQWAVILSRIPAESRADALAALRNNPPQLVKLARHTQPAAQSQPDIDNLTRKYLAQLGVREETYLKLTQEDNHASINQ